MASSEAAELRSTTIVRNTWVLYLRMLFTIALQFFISRMTLKLLGVSDFGIYNVIGGMTGMFTTLTGALGAATQRFLSYALGKRSASELNSVLFFAIFIHIGLAFLLIVLCECIGLWLLNHKLNIPAERMYAARWVLQFTILSCSITLAAIPFYALMIAHENMKPFAFITLGDGVIKSLGIITLMHISADYLICYAALYSFVSLSVNLCYFIYCLRHYPEVHVKRSSDVGQVWRMFSFSGWTLFSAIAGICRSQGINVLLNIFFSTIVNAARGIAYQVSGIISGFVLNFQLALNPQLVKSHAEGDQKYFFQLIFSGCRISYFLLFVLSIPLLFEMPTAIRLWLGIIPPYSVLFCRLALTNALVDTVSGPLNIAINAGGRVRGFNIVVGGLLIMNLPISYLLLKLGGPPEITFYVIITLQLVALAARLAFCRMLLHLPIRHFIVDVLARVLGCTILVGVLTLLYSMFLSRFALGEFGKLLLFVPGAMIISLLVIFLLGINFREKDYLFKALSNFMQRHHIKKFS